jgi:hypothetical protein
VSAGSGTTTTRSYMPGLFEALANRPKKEPKKFYITVDGAEHEATLEKKKWAMKQGEENLMIKDGEITVRPPPIPKTQYSILVESDKGYVFQDDDIHWPKEIAEGGVTWQIEHE